MGGRSSKRKKEEAAAAAQAQAQKTQAQRAPVPMKDRVSENDKAILDIKARMRKLKTYEKKLEEQDKTAMEKIKELIKAG